MDLMQACVRVDGNMDSSCFLLVCVYSRSDKHLISKMEKTKSCQFQLELFGESVLQFFVSFVFPNCLFGCFLRSVQFSFHLIPHFTPQAVGGGFLPVLVQRTAFSWGVSYGGALGLCKCGRNGI